jgi:uncharacterized protein (TIGR02271 family)
MTFDIQRIQPGWAVYGSDGAKIGEVTDLGPNYVLVSKGLLFPTDIYIPSSAITNIRADYLELNVSKDQIDSLGWDRPPTEEAVYGATTAPATETGQRADYTTTQPSTSELEAGGEARLPVVEEELRVGKQEVEGGGARVTTRVEETPVEEQVPLREERVEVERRPADRPVSEADLAALQEGTVEVRERREEPVVEKQARVTGEVGIRKEVEERTEAVQDTVRRTEVDVEDRSGRSTPRGYREPGTTAPEGTTEQREPGLTDRIEEATGRDIDRDEDVAGRGPAR